MNKRIREIRKLLGLSQKEFASKIGLKQNAISYMEKEGSAITEQSIKTICIQFSVHEEWLRNGEGKPFYENEKRQKEFLEIFDELTPILQEYLIKTAKDLLKAQIQMEETKKTSCS